MERSGLGQARPDGDPDAHLAEIVAAGDDALFLQLLQHGGNRDHNVGGFARRDLRRQRADRREKVVEGFAGFLGEGLGCLARRLLSRPAH